MVGHHDKEEIVMRYNASDRLMLNSDEIDVDVVFYCEICGENEAFTTMSDLGPTCRPCTEMYYGK
jgi:hypothetical protein